MEQVSFIFLLFIYKIRKKIKFLFDFYVFYPILLAGLRRKPINKEKEIKIK